MRVFLYLNMKPLGPQHIPQHGHRSGQGVAQKGVRDLGPQRYTERCDHTVEQMETANQVRFLALPHTS